MTETSTLEKAAAANVSRRRFFGIAGMMAGAGLLVSATGCKKSDDPGLDVGGGDNGILNYAYILEQLEAAFYIQVVATPYDGMSVQELGIFTQIRDHEIAHREFFKNLLANAALAAIEVDFSKIFFKKRTSVLDTAISFEDLGVSAYNGVGHLIKNVDYLSAASKIVSVEARHAATLRDIKASGTFAAQDVINSVTGLDTQRSPQEVLAIAQQFIKTKLNSLNLPS
ncbi:MAG: ferritin-like domain-containing protein [Chitinophagaceae bacterium]